LVIASATIRGRKSGMRGDMDPPNGKEYGSTKSMARTTRRTLEEAVNPLGRRKFAASLRGAKRTLWLAVTGRAFC
jgi:hypothetical protein